jgi:hypothetical protein
MMSLFVPIKPYVLAPTLTEPCYVLQVDVSPRQIQNLSENCQGPVASVTMLE